VLEPNAFTGAAVDRVGVARSEVRWLAEIEQDPDSRAMLLIGDSVVVDAADPTRPLLVDLGVGRTLTGGEPVLLGRRAGRPLWALEGRETPPARATVRASPSAGVKRAQTRA